jgi:hypothetical protein
MSEETEDYKKTREVLTGEYYSNILLVNLKLAPLTTISEKRAAWYIERNLAEDVQDSVRKDRFPQYSRVVKLNFKAKMEDKMDPFYQQIIETQCVVCGKRQGLTLHHVVPSVIRKWFPDEHKNHSHGWCVLLCEKHHGIADAVAMEVHAEEIKLLDQKILAENKRIKAEWAADFIVRNGGIEKVKELYRGKFRSLEPKFLPDGFLADHAVREFPMPEDSPVEISLTKEE